MRILVAEDELPLARALVKIIEKHNCSADAVHNGLDALLYLESGSYDALVLDEDNNYVDGDAYSVDFTGSDKKVVPYKGQSHPNRVACPLSRSIVTTTRVQKPRRAKRQRFRSRHSSWTTS